MVIELDESLHEKVLKLLVMQKESMERDNFWSFEDHYGCNGCGEVVEGEIPEHFPHGADCDYLLNRRVVDRLQTQRIGLVNERLEEPNDES